MFKVLAYITGMNIDNPLLRKGINYENVKRLSDNSSCKLVMV